MEKQVVRLLAFLGSGGMAVFTVWKVLKLPILLLTVLFVLNALTPSCATLIKQQFDHRLEMKKLALVEELRLSKDAHAKAGAESEAWHNQTIKLNQRLSKLTAEVAHQTQLAANFAGKLEVQVALTTTAQEAMNKAQKTIAELKNAPPVEKVRYQDRVMYNDSETERVARGVEADRTAIRAKLANAAQPPSEPVESQACQKARMIEASGKAQYNACKREEAGLPSYACDSFRHTHTVYVKARIQQCVN